MLNLYNIITILTIVFSLIFGFILMYIIYRVVGGIKKRLIKQKNRYVLKKIVVNRYGKEKGTKVYNFFKGLGKT